MGNMCDIICFGVFDIKVVLVICELNGVWSLGKEDVCKGFVINFLDVIFFILIFFFLKKKKDFIRK